MEAQLNSEKHDLQASNSPSLLSLYLRTTFFTLIFLAIFILITLGVISLYAKQKIDLFTRESGTSFAELVTIAKEGWRTVPAQTNQRVNFLILGTDDLGNRDHATQLTDTMLMASLNLGNGQVSMYSLPRDLWIDEYKTKINALYEYGKDRYPGEPQKFPKEVLEQFTGVTIHHTVVINLDTLAKLIDTMGGIDVDVKDTFIDTQFPRPDVDVNTVHDPKLLYMTVEFKQGIEHMNGARVLEYVRSRHSASEQEGTDIARGQRQQEVILNVIDTLKNPSFFRDVGRAGRLYRFYQDHFAQYLLPTEAIGLGKTLFPLRNQVQFHSASPSIFPEDPQGVLAHPKPLPVYQNQWVYIARSIEAFKKDLATKLGMS